MDVEITGSETRRLSVLHPNGSTTEETFTPYARQYQLMRTKAGIGLLRGWVPSSGYEYFSVPEDAYKRAAPK